MAAATLPSIPVPVHSCPAAPLERPPAMMAASASTAAGSATGSWTVRTSQMSWTVSLKSSRAYWDKCSHSRICTTSIPPPTASRSKRQLRWMEVQILCRGILHASRQQPGLGSCGRAVVWPTALPRSRHVCDPGNRRGLCVPGRSPGRVLPTQRAAAGSHAHGPGGALPGRPADGRCFCFHQKVRRQPCCLSSAGG